MIYTSALVTASCKCRPVNPALPVTSDQHSYNSTATLRRAGGSCFRGSWQLNGIVIVPVQRMLLQSKKTVFFHHRFLVEILFVCLDLQKLPALPSFSFTIACVSWSKVFLLPFIPPTTASCKDDRA